MKRSLALIASIALLGAGCGTNTLTVSPQERQQLQQMSRDANRKVDAINACWNVPLERYDQCMRDQGQRPDGP